jgi:hypothetical protein
MTIPGACLNFIWQMGCFHGAIASATKTIAFKHALHSDFHTLVLILMNYRRINERNRKAGKSNSKKH